MDDSAADLEIQSFAADGSDDGAGDAHVHRRGEFFGCYLLVCRNPKYLGRTYIGYTVDPNRRITQHNRGKQAGGAWRTSGRGPWDMVLIIHGFPSDVSALRFEWAWQHPQKSRRLNTLKRKLKSETPVAFRLRVLAAMLRTGPWHRLPLTVRWLKQECATSFPPDQQPPIHMPIAYGLVDLQRQKTKAKGRGASQEEPTEADTASGLQGYCDVCKLDFDVNDEEQLLLPCYHKKCIAVSHVQCLARRFCAPGELLPVQGPCTSCGKELLWGELIRKPRARQKSN